jgi:lipopolysaccharide exporter
MDETRQSEVDPSLTAQTLRGVKWTYLSTFVNAGLQIVVTAVLARILAPDAFGLVVMANLVLRFGQYFAQMGLGQAIVQRSQLTQEHVRAAFWASVLIGTLFSGVTWVGAPLAAAAFDSPELTKVLAFMGLSFLLVSLQVTPLGLLRRQMRFRGVAVADISAYVIGYGCVGVLTALSHWGVWSLVAAALVQTAVSTLVCTLLTRPNVRPLVRWAPYRQLLGFGSRVSVITFLEFLNANLDTIVVGRMRGADLLGYYSRALNLISMPMYYMSTSLSRVLYPSVARVQDDRARVSKAYLDILTVFAGFGLPIALGMSGAAREIILVLYGSKWTASIPVMRLAAVASVLAMLSHFGGIVLEATARLRDKLAMRSAQLAIFACALIGLGRIGLVGYALAFALSELFLHIAMAWRIGVFTGVRRIRLAQAYGPGAMGGALLLICTYGESYIGTSFNLPVVGILGAQLVTGVAVMTVVVLRFAHGRLFAVVDERLKPVVKSRLLTRVLSVARSLSAAKDISPTEAQ